MRSLIGLLVVHMIGVSAAWGVPVDSLSNYSNLAAAVDSLGSVETELWLDADDYSNATVPKTLAVRPVNGYIQSGTVTWNGPILGDPQFQWLEDEGHSGLKLSNVLWFGAVGDTSDVRVECQNAIDAVTAGGTVLVPIASSFYKIDAANSTESLTVATRCNIVVEGELRGTSYTHQAAPAFVMNIMADDVVLGGSGTICGVGKYNVVSDDYAKMPGLVRIESDGVVVKDLTFKNPPQTAIHLVAAHQANIYGCKFTGGPLVAVATSPQHFYIYLSRGPGNVSIHDNVFFMDSGLRSTRNAICNSSRNEVHNLAIINNQFIGMHEHAVYAKVFNSICSGNIIKYTQAAGQQKGNAIKFGGDHNVIKGNTIYNAAKGGITAYSASNTIISNNVIYGFGHVGILISSNARMTPDGYDENIIDSNVLYAAVDDDSVTVYDGIRYRGRGQVDVAVTDASCMGGKITNNIITNAGSTAYNKAAISVYHDADTSPEAVRVMSDFDISGNMIRMPGRIAIYANQLTKSRITDNTVLNPQNDGSRVIHLVESTLLTIDGNIARDEQVPAKIDTFLYLSGTKNGDIELIDNACFADSLAVLGTNPTYSAFGRGNRLSEEDRLNGVFTMRDEPTLTIENKNVNSDDLANGLTTIQIAPLNGAAALVMGGKRCLYVSDKEAQESFTVSTSNGADVPDSNCVFAYEIVQ